MLGPNELSHESLSSFLDVGLTTATASPMCELVGFLFPRIREPDELVRLVGALISTGVISLGHTEIFGDITTISLRATVSNPTVTAWVLGFGPFRHMPLTRRAPSTEIIIRPKVKPASLFHRINQDRSVGHLADAPLHMNDAYTELVWQETLQSVCGILGHPPNKFSAAKTTFCVPSRFWRGSSVAG